MSIDTTWLRCPNCFSALSAVADGVYGCPTGHRYDRSKFGFLTLLPPKAPRTIGDDREMLAARDAFLRGGAYAPIAGALVDLARSESMPEGSSLRLADFGCGTGYYAAALASSVDGASLLVADRSPDAVRLSLRSLHGATGIVMDIWRPFPVRAGCVDVALNVFAPRNAAEFARVLSPGGILLTVVPTERHLREVRAAGGMLDVPAGKTEQVVEQFAAADLAFVGRRSVEYALDLAPAERSLVADMGPAAHHRDREASAAPISESATVSVDVLCFRLPS